jgi:hypothetical protein
MQLKKVDHWLSALPLAAILIVFLIPADEAQSRVEVTGPKTVVPGKKVTFRATGFKPNFAFAVRLDAGGAVKDLSAGVNGGYVETGPPRRRVVRIFQADDSGRAVVKFRFPKRRIVCGASCADERPPWKKGSRVWVGFIRPRDGYVDPKVVAHRFVRIAKRTDRVFTGSSKRGCSGQISYFSVITSSRGVRCPAAREIVKRFWKKRVRLGSPDHSLRVRGFRCRISGSSPRTRATCTKDSGRKYIRFAVLDAQH